MAKEAREKVPLLLKEMPIKTTMPKKKEKDRKYQASESSRTLTGNIEETIGTITLGNFLAVSAKVDHIHRICSSKGDAWVPEACMKLITAALFIRTSAWKQPNCPSTVERISRLWSAHTMEYYTARKMNSIYMQQHG